MRSLHAKLAIELNRKAAQLIAARNDRQQMVEAQWEAIEAITVHLGHALPFEHRLED